MWPRSSLVSSMSNCVTHGRQVAPLVSISSSSLFVAAALWFIARDPLIRSLESRERTTCPICDEPIALVCDGLVAQSLSPDGGIQEDDDMKNKIITFKYGKQVYRLSIEQNPPSENMNVIGWALTFLWPFASGGGNQQVTTAQQRMAKALGMNVERGIKILHKGKVLYPSPSTPMNSESSMMELSNRLVSIGVTEWESSTRKIGLTVMGTRSGSEVLGRTDQSSMGSNILGTLVQLPFRFLHFSITLCFHFFGSIVRPLLPPSQPNQNDHQD